MKVSELTGLLLDIWVAKAAGHQPNKYGNLLDVRESGGAPLEFRPSTDWSHGGPIIERERISIDFDTPESGPIWLAFTEIGHEGDGNTPLAAAMRAFVHMKFGDEVPDE